MKNLLFYAFGFMLMMNCLTIDAQETKKTTTVSPEVEVYYFHFTRRCQTCQSVEDNAKQALTILYPEKVRLGEYTFKSLNLDDATTKPIAKKYEVGGQTLLVVSGTKKLDITDKGFMNAYDVDKMKVEIKKAIDSVSK